VSRSFDISITLFFRKLSGFYHGKIIEKSVLLKIGDKMNEG
jgi:hypothetical protein